VSDPDATDLDEPEIVPLGEGVGDRRTDDAALTDERAEVSDAGWSDDDEGDDDERDDVNRAPAPVATAVLHHITRSVVDDPDAVDITAIPLRAHRVRLAVRVAPNDFGRLIGRRGRVAAAVRTLVGAAAVKDGVDVEVEFVE
jgi:predicted RNA-binding protein YlqC (UPF0109 family)